MTSMPPRTKAVDITLTLDKSGYWRAFMLDDYQHVAYGHTVATARRAIIERFSDDVPERAKSSVYRTRFELDDSAADLLDSYALRSEELASGPEGDRAAVQALRAIRTMMPIGVEDGCEILGIPAETGRRLLGWTSN